MVRPPLASGPRTITAPRCICTSSISSAPDQRTSNSVPTTWTEYGPASITHFAAFRCVTRTCARPLSSSTRLPCASMSVTRVLVPGSSASDDPSEKRSSVPPLALART